MTEQMICGNCGALYGHKLSYFKNMVEIMKQNMINKSDINHTTQDELNLEVTVKNGRKRVITIEDYVLDQLNIHRQCCRMSVMTSVDTSKYIH